MTAQSNTNNNEEESFQDVVSKLRREVEVALAGLPENQRNEIRKLLRRLEEIHEAGSREMGN